MRQNMEYPGHETVFCLLRNRLFAVAHFGFVFSIIGAGLLPYSGLTRSTH